MTFERVASSVLSLLSGFTNPAFAAAFLFSGYHIRSSLNIGHSAFFYHDYTKNLGGRVDYNTFVDVLSLLSLLSLFFHFNSWLSSRWRNGTGYLLSPLPEITASDWESEIALITGGCGGLGLEIGKQLASKGSKVVLWDVVPPSQPLPNNLNWTRCDVSSNAEVEIAAKELKGKIGQPTILINNAGVTNGKLLVDLSEIDVLRMTGVNLHAQFWTLRAFLPGMLTARRGHIVSITSVMGHLGVAQMTDYVATKHALVGLHESLRYELDNKYNVPQIKTSLYSLGHLQTPLFSNVTFSPLTKLFLPSLESSEVARRIVSGIEKRRSEEVGMPFAVNFAWIGRGLPSWARDFVQWVSGADHSMSRAQETTTASS